MWQTLSQQKNKRKAQPARFNHKILIADDDQNLTQQLCKLLAKSGFECTVTGSGKDCIRELGTGAYDLLIAEILIPEVDGYDLCRYVRNNFRFLSLPVIFLTIMKDKNEILKSFELGVNDYITKPFQSSDLITRIKSVLLRAGKNEDIHPLTRLPGRNILQRRLSALIEEKELFCAFAADIRGLRFINRAYGFAEGDKLLKMTSDTIAGAVEQTRSSIQFLCHTGADDFVFATEAHVRESLAKTIIEGYNIKMQAFFSDKPTGPDNGSFMIKNRKGDMVAVPFPALSMGAASNEYMDFEDVRPLFKELDEVLSRAKQEKTSFCYTNQRQD